MHEIASLLSKEGAEDVPQQQVEIGNKEDKKSSDLDLTSHADKPDIIRIDQNDDPKNEKLNKASCETDKGIND